MIEKIIGLESSLHEIYTTVKNLAPLDINTLITGETGTGKEVFAHLIHSLSSVCNGPFVALNCSTIPEDLMESELFGHEKGVYTGALESRKGYIDKAGGGTLFLDEIGDLSFKLQAKLLRVLQEKIITPLGAREGHPVNFRLLSATNKNLTNSIREKKFRSDLYYRINTYEIKLPPLRERKEDIPELFNFFLKEFAKEQQWPIPAVTPKVEELITNYNWPGNIRELKNWTIRLLLESGGLSVFDPEKIKNKLKSSEEKEQDKLITLLADSMIKHKTDPGTIVKKAYKEILKRFNNNIRIASESTHISKDRFYRYSKSK